MSNELVQQFEEVNKALDKSCDLTREQPLSNIQIVLMADAGFAAAGYVTLIEDDPHQQLISLATETNGSKTFTPAQTKMSIPSGIRCIKRFWAHPLGSA